MANRWGHNANSGEFIFLDSKITADGDCSHENKRCLLFGRKAMTKLDNISSGHVWIWELDYQESWAPKNWRIWTMVLEKTPESPLDCKEIQPVYPKGDQSWVVMGRTDVKAETPILWPCDAKSWLIGKDPDAGKNWRQIGRASCRERV